MEEDQLVVALRKELGGSNWAKIAEQLPGRCYSAGEEVAGEQ